MSSRVPPAATAPLLPAGATCERSSLPPAVRFAITFGVLYGLKRGLPATGLPPSAQVLALLVVATGFVWRFWWRCSPDRRGPLLLTGALWAAGLAKIALR